MLCIEKKNSAFYNGGGGQDPKCGNLHFVFFSESFPKEDIHKMTFRDLGRLIEKET